MANCTEYSACLTGRNDDWALWNEDRGPPGKSDKPPPFPCGTRLGNKTSLMVRTRTGYSLPCLRSLKTWSLQTTTFCWAKRSRMYGRSSRHSKSKLTELGWKWIHPRLRRWGFEPQQMQGISCVQERPWNKLLYTSWQYCHHDRG